MKLHYNRVITYSLLLIIFFQTTACTLQPPRVKSSGLPQREYTYQIPEKIAGGWETSSLEKEGVNSDKIVELIEGILRENYKNIHSVLLVKNGKLILDEYFYGYDRHTKHGMMSTTKSVTSILIGIAVDNGIIDNVDKKAYQFFPEYENLNWSDLRAEIRLENLLTMTAGLEFNEYQYHFYDSRNSVVGMYRSSDPIKYVFQQKMLYEPGNIFNYSTGLTLVLGGVIRNTSGLYADTFAEKYLFSPLGISEYIWEKHPDGTIQTGGGPRGGLLLKPRDMAKIGQIMLKNGKWNGRQIVSQKWIAESTRERVSNVFAGWSYGYQWWQAKDIVSNIEIEMFFAAGHGGQFIFVFPSLELIAVFTSKRLDNPLGELRPLGMLKNYIIPSCLPTAPPVHMSKIDPVVLDNYVGKYRTFPQTYLLPKDTLVVFSDADRLFCRTPDGENFELFSIAKNKFMGTWKGIGNSRLSFVRDRNDKIKHLFINIVFALNLVRVYIP